MVCCTIFRLLSYIRKTRIVYLYLFFVFSLQLEKRIVPVFRFLMGNCTTNKTVHTRTDEFVQHRRMACPVIGKQHTRRD